jgi:hypothetical protein
MEESPSRQNVGIQELVMDGREATRVCEEDEQDRGETRDRVTTPRETGRERSRTDEETYESLRRGVLGIIERQGRVMSAITDTS